MKSVKTEKRARLKSAVLHALMMVSIEGPDIDAVDLNGGSGRMEDAWHQKKGSRDIGNIWGGTQTLT
ncbi:hypothetical protein DPMN_080030 [Dreissena polymorpha]|uniref:Uncharacterized protein n=1 Tax=Dreissena polymorpha TaxID=45954 RepID=A0A9D3YVK2_DREPO|nr:hypothetical protein DPMN_080030 [Dreissena polymorpha]